MFAIVNDFPDSIAFLLEKGVTVAGLVWFATRAEKRLDAIVLAMTELTRTIAASTNSKK